MRRPAAGLLALALTAAVSTPMLAAAARLPADPEEPAIQDLTRTYVLEAPSDGSLRQQLETLLQIDVGWSIRP